MFDEDLREKYQRARKLYKKGLLGEADRLLEELDRVYPNHAEILYARVRCLGKLGLVSEARVLANRMQTMLNDPRARDLQAWLSTVKPKAPKTAGKM